MLIPLTFKNNDTESVKTKIGKITTQSARMMYDNTFSKEVGIISNYKKDDLTESCSIASTETIGNNIRLTFNKGAVNIYGGLGVIEQGTTFDIPKTTDIANGSLGIKVNLSHQAGSEMMFYYKDNQTLQQDNILIDEQAGVYELELYKFSLSGGIFTLGDRNTTQIITSVGKRFDDILNKYLNVDYIIEEKVSEDKSTWYRKWASGFKECYVIKTMPSGSISEYYRSYEINLPIEFNSNNYSAFANTINGTGLSGNIQDVNYIGALMNVIAKRETNKVSIMALHYRTVCVYCMGF